MALAHIPAHDRDLWVRMAFAVKSEHGEDGYEVWRAWSESAENYREKSALEVWRSAKPGSLTIGTLLYEAKQRGFHVNGEGSRIDAAEIERYRLERAEAVQRDEADRKERQARAAEWAAEIWKAAGPADAGHAYLKRKAVAPTATMREIPAEKVSEIARYTPKQDGEPLQGRLLVLPLKIDGKLASLELIDEAGRKTALYGGARSGGLWAAQPLPEEEAAAIAIGEGIATMLSVREATGLPVVAALSAGNLPAVAVAMRKRYPSGLLTVCADLGNGEEKARKAAARVNAHLALPEFLEQAADQTDFNDMARVRGLAAVKANIEGAAQPAPQPDRPQEVVYTRLSDIEAKPIRWLWPSRIARGKVSMIAGHPGLGKSQITSSLAAIVTLGGRWPVDRTPCERGSVLFLSAEDDPADTIRPRLEAAGADLKRIHILQAVRDGVNAAGDEIQRAFNLKEDIRRLEGVLAQIGDVALVVIDPVSAYLGNTESHNNAEVRALLAPLSEMASRKGVAVVAVSHLNKGGAGGSDALLRVTGSLAFVAAARAAFIVAKDPENEARRLFLPAKNNVAADTGGLAFRIEGRGIGRGIETSLIVWEDEPVSGMSADELLRAPTDTEDRSELEEAADWLRVALSEGGLDAREVFRLGEGQGFHKRALQRARQRVGAQTKRDGFGKGSKVVWFLPIDDRNPIGDSQKRLSSMGASVTYEGDGEVTV